MVKHQYRLRRNYQFPNAVRCIIEGDTAGWVVNRVGAKPWHGVVRYTVDSDRVAWIESEDDFGTNESAAEMWVSKTVADITAQRRLKERAVLASLLTEALSVEGTRHKQWYLWKIAEELGIDLRSQWNDDYPEPDKGIEP